MNFRYIALASLLFFGGIDQASAAVTNTPTATVGSTQYTFKYSYSGTPSLLQIFIDANNSASSGFSIGGIGAEFLLENGILYKFSGTSQTSWGWTSVKGVTFSSASGVASWTLLKSDIGSVSTFSIVGKTNLDSVSAKLSVTSVTPVASSATPVITSDSTKYYLKYNYSGTPTLFQTFIDANNSTSSGFSIGGIGAEYLLENGTLYRFSGTTQSTWGWTSVKSVTFSSASATASWAILKSDIGSPSIFTVVGKNSLSTVSAKVTVTATISPSPTPTATATPTPTSTSSPVPVSGAMSTIYPLASTATFNNPERGFHNYVGMTTSQHSSNVASGSTLAISVIDLGAFRNDAISPTFLTAYQNMFNAARSAGVKMTLLHKYHEIQNSESDPSEATILGHIGQLGPIMAANADVILTIHAGFIGAWGEWYYSQHTDAFRKTVVMALLNHLPPSLTVAVRTPAFKIDMFEMSAPNVAGVDAAFSRRVGHHNDCFLASSSDFGTNGGYSLGNPSDWRDFIGQENKLLSIPVGGETCAVSSYSTCSNAKVQLARQGYSYLNIDYNASVLDSWRSGGCFDEINRNLGYRFKIKQAQISAEASRVGSLAFNMTLENVGYAGMINARPVKLVLYNSQGEYAIPLNQNPRTWTPGVHTISQTINLTSWNIPAGDYNVAIWMPDSAAGLQNRPGYSVQFANQQTWDSTKGRNILKNSSLQNLVIRIK